MKKDITDKDFKIATIISTYFGLGFSRICPGTVGSLMTFPLFFIINFLLLKIGINTFSSLFLIYILIMVLLFSIGIWAVDIYITKNKKEDPSEVVIDEVIGQMIAYMMPTILTLYYFIFLSDNLVSNTLLIGLTTAVIIVAPLVFFRFFDIIKPGLIGYFDTKVKGAIGVIMDDVIAGIYAGGVVCLILSLLFISLSFY